MESMKGKRERENMKKKREREKSPHHTHRGSVGSTLHQPPPLRDDESCRPHRERRNIRILGRLRPHLGWGSAHRAQHGPPRREDVCFLLPLPLPLLLLLLLPLLLSLLFIESSSPPFPFTIVHNASKRFFSSSFPIHHVHLSLFQELLPGRVCAWLQRLSALHRPPHRRTHPRGVVGTHPRPRRGRGVGILGWVVSRSFSLFPLSFFTLFTLSLFTLSLLFLSLFTLFLYPFHLFILILHSLSSLSASHSSLS